MRGKSYSEIDPTKIWIVRTTTSGKEMEPVILSTVCECLRVDGFQMSNEQIWDALRTGSIYSDNTKIEFRLKQ